MPASGPARSPALGGLKEKRAALVAESRRVVVELYGLESRLAQARAALARVDARAAELARRQASARARYQAARRTLTLARFNLGRQLRLLYQQEQPDPIAVVLGAASLDDAIDGLESITRTARSTKAVVAQSRQARIRAERAKEELSVEAGKARTARLRLAASLSDLERTLADRRTYIGHLRHEQELTASQIASLRRRAQDAQRRAVRITRSAATAEISTTSIRSSAAPIPQNAPAESAGPSEPPPSPVESVSGQDQAEPAAAPAPPRPGGTMSVSATGYCLRGTTATGLPVGPGIVAVDPTVIPLGTRMTVPGYGEGVAADIGGAIKGARIDVWIASCAKAAAFTRTATITFR